MTDDGAGAAFDDDGGPTHDGGQPHVYDLGEGESPSEGVILAVSAILGRPPDELDPLYDAVDPDALDSFFDRGRGGGRDARVTFPFEGLTVTVDSGERVHVTE